MKLRNKIMLKDPGVIVRPIAMEWLSAKGLTAIARLETGCLSAGLEEKDDQARWVVYETKTQRVVALGPWHRGGDFPVNQWKLERV